MAPGSAPDWAKKLFAVTLFVDDFPCARQWYTEIFAMPVIAEDADSVTFAFPGGVYVNLNSLTAAADHVEASRVVEPGTTGRSMITVTVDDVDAVYDRLKAKGIQGLVGPVDRPWGPRTVTFADPSGNFWELSS